MIIKKIVKLLEKMGYNVADNERYEYINVSLKTKENFISLSVTYRELLHTDFIVGEIVRKMNEAVVR